MIQALFIARWDTRTNPVLFLYKNWIKCVSAGQQVVLGIVFREVTERIECLGGIPALPVQRGC